MPSLSLQLDQAKEHVRQLARRIVEQTLLIEQLRSDRHDTAAAERLMATFLDLMTKLTLHREGLEREAEERSRNANLRYPTPEARQITIRPPKEARRRMRCESFDG